MKRVKITFNETDIREYQIDGEFNVEAVSESFKNFDTVLLIPIKGGLLVLPPAIWANSIIQFFND